MEESLKVQRSSVGHRFTLSILIRFIDAPEARVFGSALKFIMPTLYQHQYHQWGSNYDLEILGGYRFGSSLTVFVRQGLRMCRRVVNIIVVHDASVIVRTNGPLAEVVQP